MPDTVPDDGIWFIDGSLVDGSQRATGRTGFGIVVVSPSGDLLAYGHGEPPDWIEDAAGAEAWAYFVVSRENIEPSDVVTDCKGVLDALSAGVAVTSSHDKRLARVWNMTAVTDVHPPVWKGLGGPGQRRRCVAFSKCTSRGYFNSPPKRRFSVKQNDLH